MLERLQGEMVWAQSTRTDLTEMDAACMDHVPGGLCLVIFRTKLYGGTTCFVMSLRSSTRFSIGGVGTRWFTKQFGMWLNFDMVSFSLCFTVTLLRH